MLAEWATTPEREAAASKLPLELFQVNTVGLSDDEAEAQEVAHAERFRNIYRYSFGDKAPSHRTYVRSEVWVEWMLFVSIFALVHPEKAKSWFDPEREVQMRQATTERSLRAHGRKSRSAQARNSHSRRPPNAMQTVVHPKIAMED
ncbi:MULTISPECIES: hypothetical protein [Hyphomonas]|uniref:hypothetical protein n=1 Tax=Hyphomonas TaxID=85 RepID=UPI00351812C9